jgi:hypothetical protein
LAISTIAKPVYFVTVTVLDDQSRESDYAPAIETALNVPDVESSLSTEISATPEPAVRFPNLPNERGCFIATAAYGSPLEPHVQTLRTFRDQYLLTNSLGKKWVAIYYQKSPPLARWLEEHPYFKPAVRIILSPFVWFVGFWMGVTSLVKTLIICVLLSIHGFLLYRWGVMLKGRSHY